MTFPLCEAWGMMTCSKELITHVKTIEHCLSERNIKLSAGILPQLS
jgi:hypothetical protein